MNLININTIQIQYLNNEINNGNISNDNALIEINNLKNEIKIIENKIKELENNPCNDNYIFPPVIIINKEHKHKYHTHIPAPIPTHKPIPEPIIIYKIKCDISANFFHNFFDFFHYVNRTWNECECDDYKIKINNTHFENLQSKYNIHLVEHKHQIESRIPYEHIVYYWKDASSDHYDREFTTKLRQYNSIYNYYIIDTFYIDNKKVCKCFYEKYKKEYELYFKK